MNILAYHRTTDADLKVGLQVAYQDTDGGFTNIGTITDSFEQDGQTLYLIDTAIGAYLADELKLVD